MKARSLLRELIIIVVLAVVLYLVLHSCIQVFEVVHGSMEPNLPEGRFVLVNKTAYWFGDPKRGDIVVFHSPLQDEDLVKRVIGLPGEEVEIDEKGVVYIDGVPLDEPYITEPSTSATPPKDVPPGEYFVMGDNRNQSADSRGKLGTIPRDNIIGKAWLIVWPLGDLGGAPNQRPQLGGEGEAVED